MTMQRELEARYARAVAAPSAVFVYADHVDDVFTRPDVLGPEDRVIDMIGGAGLRVADARAAAREAHAAGGRLWVDVTVPSFFGCHAFDLGVDVQCEALDRIAAGGLARKVVALSARGDVPLASDRIDVYDLAAISDGLETASARMQRHFDHARALAEYLACCECLAGVSYPGLSSHPDHDLATRVLCHGFGPAVDFELLDYMGRTAGDFIEHCRLNGRDRAAGGSHTRLHARDGRQGSAVRVFAGLDDPLEIVADLDQAMRWFCNPSLI